MSQLYTLVACIHWYTLVTCFRKKIWEIRIVRNRLTLRLVEIDTQKKLKYVSRMKAHLQICKKHLKDYLQHIHSKNFQDYPEW